MIKALTETDRAKRAVVMLMEVFKAANGGRTAPLDVRLDIQALMTLIRKAEQDEKLRKDGIAARPVDADDWKRWV